nr:restriction endonuclease subunit S [Thauera aromatica]
MDQERSRHPAEGYPCQQPLKLQTECSTTLVSVMGTIGRAALVPADVEPGIINPRLVLYRAKERVIAPRYLQVFINNPTSQRYFSLAAQGTTMEGLNMVSIGELHISLPSLDEQHEILEFIDGETAHLDALTTEATRAITLLKERRSALISAAVTGKIDVRGVAELAPAAVPA